MSRVADESGSVGPYGRSQPRTLADERWAGCQWEEHMGLDQQELQSGLRGGHDQQLEIPLGWAGPRIGRTTMSGEDRGLLWCILASQ